MRKATEHILLRNLSQDLKMQAKIFRLIELLELKENELREPYSKSLSEEIFEIRAIQGNNIHACYISLWWVKNNIDKRFCQENAKNTRR